jgi:hypothetical protein
MAASFYVISKWPPIIAPRGLDLQMPVPAF